MEPKRIIFDRGGRVRVSPPMWDGNTIKVQPGDLAQFAPEGTGIYGYQEPTPGNPFLSAPLQDDAGGAVYFGNGIGRADFDVLMRVMGVTQLHSANPMRRFAAFTAVSEHPGKDGYLVQMRLVSDFGLKFLFGAIPDAEPGSFPEQALSMVDTLWAFVETQRAHWGTGYGEDLEGLFGGDGDFAREQLSFGFLVENGYHHVYRIWSRAWLVTK